ncbi:MAG: hypothetical protein ABS36_05810 [Acidobacteria bacterium SCN 69-37]|nr:MAG: hypothetical protein ABS36_05810 [Acidobacteria bacterium SCN 69-37]
MSALGLVAILANALLLYTVAAVAARAVRRRDAATIDIVPYLALLFVCVGLPSSWLPGAFGHAVRAALPLAALLIIRHFRSVPSSVPLFGWSIPVVIGVSGLVWGLDVLQVTRWATPAYLVVGLAVGVLVLGQETRRSTGVHRRRVGLVTMGTTALAASLLVALLAAFLSVGSRRMLLPLGSLINSAAFVCYFLAFAPPRRLIARWRNNERAAFLAGTHEREPEERGRMAAEDLIEGVRRCVGPSAAFVARPQAPGSDRLVVRAATDRALIGATLSVSEGMPGIVHSERWTVLGTVGDCPEDLARLLAPYGRALLVAPIVADAESWGIVGTVHRRVPLFPADDLHMLEQLGRSAAIAFDHAQLIVERRERARQEADARLRDLESRVGLMLDSIRDYAMLVLDEAGTVAAWHVGAEDVFGYTREQITRESAAPLFDLAPEAFAAWLADAAVHGKAEREGTCRRPDGRTFRGVTTIRPLAAADGSLPGFVVVTCDVTERRTLEERLHHGQKMQAIGQLAGGIAHDFNNLLTAIIGYTDWLERDMAGDPRAGQVREIQHAAGRAADLTRQLLAFSRRQVVQTTSLDLTRLVRDLLPMLRRLIGSRIEIVDSTAPRLPPVFGDRSQVEQVVVNLVLNARDAMPDGGRITILTADVPWQGGQGRSAGHDSHVLLTVADTGCGMDAETRRRAFEPFFTTKAVGSGTGLGLATVYGIVQQMGGVIEIDSEIGCGSTFRIGLPHAAEPACPPHPPLPQAVTTGCETLLLIEDDDALRAYLVHVLEGHGYHVIAAEGAEAALTVTEEEIRAVDLVISDVVVPGMSGPEIVAELEHLRPGLPALYISGGADLGGGAGEGTGPTGLLLQKPFSSTDLLARVRHVLSVS